jgi:hypothetical protein
MLHMSVRLGACHLYPLLEPVPARFLGRWVHSAGSRHGAMERKARAAHSSSPGCVLPHLSLLGFHYTKLRFSGSLGPRLGQYSAMLPVSATRCVTVH